MKAGAQGAHKIHQGYMPVETYSAHWMEDSGLRGAIADYLEHERREVREDIAGLMERSPFRKNGNSGEVQHSLSRKASTGPRGRTR